MFRRLTGSALAAAAFAAVMVAGAPSQAAMVILEGDDNFGSDPIKVQITIDQDGDDVKFTLDILPETFFGTGNIGDLRGFFLHIADESLLAGLSVTGADVTDFEFDADSVINLGGGNNLNGGPDDFDIGLEIGTSGIGTDDIQTTMFVFSHTTESLAVADFLFDGQEFGARATSVGPAGGDRGGSAKIAGPGTVIPAPAALPAGLALLGLVAMRRRKKA